MMLREVVAFYRRGYRPDRMTLIAVGDASHGELLKAVTDSFQSWSPAPDEAGASAPIDAARLEAPRHTHERLAVVHRPGAAQSELRIGQVVAQRRTSDYHALVVLNMVLGGSS
jgi:predicted Zn-dependent peptidase